MKMCPRCGKSGAGHLASHCNTCTSDGIPVALVEVYEESVPQNTNPPELLEDEDDEFIPANHNEWPLF